MPLLELAGVGPSDLRAARAQMECHYLHLDGDLGCLKKEKGRTLAVGSPGVPVSSQFPPQPSCSWEGGSVRGCLSPLLGVPGHWGQARVKPGPPRASAGEGWAGWSQAAGPTRSLGARCQVLL